MYSNSGVKRWSRIPQGQVSFSTAGPLSLRSLSYWPGCLDVLAPVLPFCQLMSNNGPWTSVRRYKLMFREKNVIFSSTTGILRHFICHKFVFNLGWAPDPARGAHDAPPDPLVDWGRWYPLSILHPLDAYGISILVPLSVLNYISWKLATLGKGEVGKGGGRREKGDRREEKGMIGFCLS